MPRNRLLAIAGLGLMLANLVCGLFLLGGADVGPDALKKIATDTGATYTGDPGQLFLDLASGQRLLLGSRPAGAVAFLDTTDGLRRLGRTPLVLEAIDGLSFESNSPVFDDTIKALRFEKDGAITEVRDLPRSGGTATLGAERLAEIPLQASSFDVFKKNWAYAVGGLLLALSFLPAGTKRESEPGVDEADRFGDYVRQEQIGEGAMGVVYRARGGDGGRNYALKVLREEVCRSPDFVGRFQREVDICSEFDHPGLVSIHAHGEKEGRLWLVMDLVEGAELREKMDEGTLDAGRAREIVLALCEALEHAHSRDVVHRDLKPENILLRAQDGTPVITDFGLARGEHYETITKTDATLGTPAYMPPEQVTGETPADARADLYSLGCILYEMLAGTPPFTGEPIQVIVAHMSQPPPALPSFDGGLDAVVERLLQKDPEARFQTAAQLAAALH